MHQNSNEVSIPYLNVTTNTIVIYVHVYMRFAGPQEFIKIRYLKKLGSCTTMLLTGLAHTEGKCS